MRAWIAGLLVSLAFIVLKWATQIDPEGLQVDLSLEGQNGPVSSV